MGSGGRESTCFGGASNDGHLRSWPNGEALVFQTSNGSSILPDRSQRFQDPFFNDVQHWRALRSAKLHWLGSIPGHVSALTVGAALALLMPSGRVRIPVSALSSRFGDNARCDAGFIRQAAKWFESTCHHSRVV